MHWAQANLKSSLVFSTLHVIVLSITKRHVHSSSKEEVIAAMEDDRGDIRLVQTKDVDEAKCLKSGEHVLKVFLNIASRLERIIIFSKRAGTNYT